MDGACFAYAAERNTVFGDEALQAPVYMLVRAPWANLIILSLIQQRQPQRVGKLLEGSRHLVYGTHEVRKLIRI